MRLLLISFALALSACTSSPLSLVGSAPCPGSSTVAIETWCTDDGQCEIRSAGMHVPCSLHDTSCALRVQEAAQVCAGSVTTDAGISQVGDAQNADSGRPEDIRPETSVELCSDGLDNDGNRFVDCEDRGCCGVRFDCGRASYCGRGSSGNTSEEGSLASCSDGRDNDGNGYTDCEDRSCCFVRRADCHLNTFCGRDNPVSETTIELCSDGRDNDGNRYTDCDDRNCCEVRTDCGGTTYCGRQGSGVNPAAENTTALCSDDVDNDTDGYIDCEDRSCCAVRTSCGPATHCGRMGSSLCLEGAIARYARDSAGAEETGPEYFENLLIPGSSAITLRAGEVTIRFNLQTTPVPYSAACVVTSNTLGLDCSMRVVEQVWSSTGALSNGCGRVLGEARIVNTATGRIERYVFAQNIPFADPS